ncbi:MAG TPA: hypothetical protein PKV80_10800, partial [Leptospiraceae bacterium]|nr:hypothetical protein [Leptospiraceae bacterium]
MLGWFSGRERKIIKTLNKIMIKIITVVGARPQFVKAAAVSRELAKRSGIKELILHTGQHYDDVMSDIFFRE